MSQAEQNSDVYLGRGLLVVIPERFRKEIENRFSNLCGHDWQNEIKLHLEFIDAANVRNELHVVSAVRRKISKLNQHPTFIKPLILFAEELVDIQKKLTTIKNIYWSEIRVHPLRLLKTRELQKSVVEVGCYWFDRVISKVAKWTHENIEHQDINYWLSQFDRLQGDSKKWIGEFLLKNLNVLSSEEMATLFFQSNTQAAELVDVAHCFIRYKDGKSGDAISQVLKKSAFAAVGTDIDPVTWDSVLRNTKAHNEIVVYEDGLFTGVEIRDVLLALMGAEGGKKDVIQLSSEEVGRLKEWRHTLKFCIATDVGLRRLEDSIGELGLNVHVVPASIIKTLTSAGEEAMANNVLYRTDSDGQSFVGNPAFVKRGVFENPAADIAPKIEDAITYCRDLGRSLWKSNLEIRGKKWTHERIDDCCLGAGNMALAFAFSSSMPKSSLPMFWCHGNVVDRSGNMFTWRPLFATAHPVGTGYQITNNASEGGRQSN